MSVIISSFHHVYVPRGVRLAKITPSGDLSIYPEGAGYGPCITMSLDDWELIKRAVDVATARIGMDDEDTQL